MCASAHVNMGTPSGPDHIKVTDKLCQRAVYIPFCTLPTASIILPRVCNVILR